MIVDFTCPNCSHINKVENPISGSVTNCRGCEIAMVLALPESLEKEGKKIGQLELRYTISSSRGKKAKQTAKTISPEEKANLRQRGLFVLSRWLDTPKETIENVLEILEKGEGYDEFSIPKGSSYQLRHISAPKPELKQIQRKILDRLLYRIPVSNACHGFMPGRSIVTNAELHLPTATEVYNIDLKDAFPTVNAQWVKHLLVRYIKIPLKHLGEIVEHEALNEIIEILTALVTHNDRLPQGSPASGCLLNVACIKLDKYIYKLLHKFESSGEITHISYSRYADDLTFSSSQPIPEKLRHEVTKTVRDCGFRINPAKIKYLTKSKNQTLEVTGLVLEKNMVRIPRANLEKYRATIHNAWTTSVEEITDEQKLEVQSVVAFVKMVYHRLPHRISRPYRQFLKKHGGTPVGEGKKLSMTQYPK